MKTDPTRIAVEGFVKWNGAPFAAGTIRFVPCDATRGPEAAARIEQGQFSIPAPEGPVAGTYRVEIRHAAELSTELTDPRFYDGNDRQPPRKDLHQRELLPVAPEMVTVGADGPNRFDFVLQSSEKRLLAR